jgi:hypothetical protein
MIVEVLLDHPIKQLLGGTVVQRGGVLEVGMELKVGEEVKGGP